MEQSSYSFTLSTESELLRKMELPLSLCCPTVTRKMRPKNFTISLSRAKCEEQNIRVGKFGNSAVKKAVKLLE